MIGRRAEQIALRLPDGMRERIKMTAAANRRSVNSEIVILLEQALAFGPKAATGEGFGDTSPAAACDHAALPGG